MSKDRNDKVAAPPSWLNNSTEEAIVKEWKNKIALGIKWRQRVSGKDDRNWKRFARYYRGDWGGSDNINDIVTESFSEYLPVNKIFSYIKAVLPRIYFRNPGVVVTRGKSVSDPNTGQMIDDSMVIQDYINYLIKELKLKKTMKSVLLSVFLTGTGIIKEGYGSEFIPGEEVVLDKGKRIEYDTKIKAGLPWTKRVNCTNFVVPWGTTDFDESPWVAELVFRDIEDVKKDKNYKNRDLFKATASENIHSEENKVTKERSKNRYVKLWEIRDKKTGAFMVISTGSSKFHFKDEDVITKENFPYRMIVFNEDLATVWGICEVKIMEPQQLEFNDIRTQMREHRRNECTKWAVDPNAFTQKSGIGDINDATKPMAAIAIKDPKKNISVISASMPTDLRPSATDVDDDLRAEVGFGRNQAGEVSTGRRTASEVNIVKEASEIRNDERRDLSSDLFVDVVHDLMLISFDHVDTEMVKKITGGVWHERDTEALEYDFSLDVQPEEARLINTRVIKADAVELFDRLIQSPVINPVTLVVDLVKSFGKKEIADYVDPEMATAIQQVIAKRQEAQKEKQK